MVMEKPVVTVVDRMRLQDMVRALRSVGDPFRSHLRELTDVLDRADVVAPAEMGPDVVTMNTCVRARDVETGRPETFTLVYHGESDMFDSRLSVLTPMGVAVLGARVGDVIEFPIRRDVRRRLRIEEMLYQPEAAGNFHL
jgi:regulator of nucleoside diphosphate kinase